MNQRRKEKSTLTVLLVVVCSLLLLVTFGECGNLQPLSLISILF